MKTSRDWMIEASHQQPDLKFCSGCHEECSGKWEDIGIGVYEFWGQKGSDVQMTYMSTCCEAEVIKNGRFYEGPTDEDLEADRGDMLYDQWKDDQLMRKLEEEGGG